MRQAQDIEHTHTPTEKWRHDATKLLIVIQTWQRQAFNEEHNRHTDIRRSLIRIWWRAHCALPQPRCIRNYTKRDGGNDRSTLRRDGALLTLHLYRNRSHRPKISDPLDLAARKNKHRCNWIALVLHNRFLRCLAMYAARNAMHRTYSDYNNKHIFSVQQMIVFLYSYDGRLNFSYDHAAQHSVAQHSLRQRSNLRFYFCHRKSSEAKRNGLALNRRRTK